VTSDPHRAGQPESTGNGHLVDGGRAGGLHWGFCSDPGAHRDHNEDYVAVGGEGVGRGPVFAVADGLGGHAAGEIASRVAVECVLDTWNADGGSDAGKVLRAAVRKANTAVIDASRQTGRRGMGTTLTTLAITQREVVIAHVGDTRAYRVRTDSCVQLTSDHSRVGEMLRMKLITADQAARHPARSQLTRSLGSDVLVQIDLLRDRIETGDAFVLCSDGLWDEVGNRDISLIVAELAPEGPRAIAKRLVDTAIERGSGDNVTAMVVQLDDSGQLTDLSAKRPRFRFGRS
jgi:PPM family protein phosphatase